MSAQRFDEADALGWWANHSHRYVLPVAGAVSLAVGVSVALDSHLPWNVYAPPLLVLVGGGALASGIAALVIRRSRTSAAGRASGPVSSPSGATCPACSARALETVTSRTASWSSVRAHVRRAAPPETTLTIPPDPGGFLWKSWAAPSGHLPVELVGPVAETAYSTPTPGAPVLYEEGEPVRFDASASGVPAAGPAPRPLEESTLLPGEPAASTEIRTPGSEVSANPPGWTDSVSSEGEPSLSRSLTIHPVHHEALNPTPPHLRPRPPSATGRSHRGRPPERGVRCASCQTPVLDPPQWRRCLDCQRHLCADCVVSALLTYQRGWCPRCAEERNLGILSTSAQIEFPRAPRADSARNSTRPVSAPSTRPLSLVSTEVVNPRARARSPSPSPT